MREYSYIKRGLLRELSMDSRTPVTMLAKRLKCSRNTVISNMKMLEREFGMRYTLNFNKEAIGLVQNQIWSIKFGIKPTAEDMKEALKDDVFSQFIAQTEGDFDLLLVRKVPMSGASGSGEKYSTWAIKTVLSLLKFRPSISSSTVVMVHTGFTPVQNDIIESINLESIGIDSLDRDILLALNQNSRISYNAIAKKLDQEVETVRYRLRNLKRRGIIAKFTIVLEKPPTNYNIAFFVNYDLAPGLIERYKEAFEYYINLDGKLPLINTFQYLALTNGSFLLYGIGCFDSEEEAIKKTVMAHKEIYMEDNPKISFARIKHVIRGSLPVRNIDIEKEFNVIKWAQN